MVGLEGCKIDSAFLRPTGPALSSRFKTPAYGLLPNKIIAKRGPLPPGGGRAKRERDSAKPRESRVRALFVRLSLTRASRTLSRRERALT